MYDSNNLQDMINVLERYKYNYTKYNHKNGYCSINSDLLLKQLKLNKQEIRTQVIDEFVEQLKSDEFQKYTLDMVFETSRDLSYSQCINAFEEYIDEIAEQMKVGAV